MIAYLDASVLLRIIVPQEPRLAEWKTLEAGVTSRITAVEVARGLLRLWEWRQLTDDQYRRKSAVASVIIARLELLAVDDDVITTASSHFGAPLKTLDAIHLATALKYEAKQSRHEPPIVFATHDRQLARAAAAANLSVLGAATT